MSDNISRSIAELSSRIAGEMDAHLIESIVSLFNKGVLVHYVRSARTTFNPDNCQMTVDVASGVKFEGRDRIIELEQQLKQRDDLIKEAIKEIQNSVDYDSSWIQDRGSILTCESEPEYQRYKAHCDFLSKPEIQAIINKEKE